MSLKEQIAQSIGTVKRLIPFVEVRAAQTSDYQLEAVLLRQDLLHCCKLLQETFGLPLKDFGEAASLEPPLQQAIEAMGGIRVEQCLFLARAANQPQQAAYAALWPWASNPERITLKIGLLEVR